jgi:hypothetical protein
MPMRHTTINVSWMHRPFNSQLHNLSVLWQGDGKPMGMHSQAAVTGTACTSIAIAPGNVLARGTLIELTAGNVHIRVVTNF